MTTKKTPRKGDTPKRPGWLPEILPPLPGQAPAGRAPKAAAGKTAAGKPAKAGKAAASGKPGKAGKAPAAGKPGRGPKPAFLPDLPPAARGERVARGPAPPRGPAAPSGAPHDPYADREAQRYERPIASREAILELLASADGPQTAEQLAERLQLTAPDRFDALSRRLAAMLRDGQLLANRRGGYAVSDQLDLVRGVVVANPEGFGFLRPDPGGGDDLFLPPSELRKATHGDRVLASVTGVDRRGRREGAIVEVLERRLTRVIGRYGERGGVGYVVPDDRRVLHEPIIPADVRLGAREGQLVVAEITEPPTRGRPPFGRILSVLGDKLTPSLVVEAAIHGHDIPHDFPQAALDEAANVPLEVDGDAAVAAGRVDLRQLPLVTIDGEDAKDFDDAVYCEPRGTGYRLVVAIADVSHYVRPGTALDEEAIRRSTSVYFPGFVVPMLPETLSNGICSLMPKVERMCFVCDMQVEPDGSVHDARFYEAVMRSHARLTYTQVWQAIGEKDPAAIASLGALHKPVSQLHGLYRILAKARAARGAIEFESGEVRFVLGPAGEVVQAGMLERNDAHKLIEECMIAANVQAALALQASGIPAPVRLHERPPEQKYAELQEFLAEFKLAMPAWGRVTPGDFTALLKKVRARPDAALIESVVLRSQSMAVYSATGMGHFGLALEAYAHFTSPIRRYPDLLVHRGIKHALAGGKAANYVYAAHEMSALSLQCSERERRADEASREVDERYRCAWMEKHVGGEFEGVVTGVTSFGVFVQMLPSKVTGLVHVTQLPHDYYHFDATRKVLSGERRGDAYRLGDSLRVQVLRASVEDRRIDLRLASYDASGHPSHKPGASAPRGGKPGGGARDAGPRGGQKKKRR